MGNIDAHDDTSSPPSEGPMDGHEASRYGSCRTTKSKLQYNTRLVSQDDGRPQAATLCGRLAGGVSACVPARTHPSQPCWVCRLASLPLPQLAIMLSSVHASPKG